MIELSEEQRERLASGKAVDVSDSNSPERYVLVRKDIYERVRHLLYDDSEWTDDELRLQLALAAKDSGWDEPGMDAYDRYDEERGKQCP